jgi:predicted RecA/RadA family phage recombinase
MLKEQARLGDIYDTKDIKCVNRTGSTINPGEVFALDLAGSDGDVDTEAEQAARTTALPTASPHGNVIGVGSGHVAGWIFVVAQETIANDATGTFRARGKTKVKCVGSSAFSNGARLMATASQTYLSALTDGKASVGIALADGPASAGVISVLFNGVCFYGPACEI